MTWAFLFLCGDSFLLDVMMPSGVMAGLCAEQDAGIPGNTKKALPI